MSFLTNVGTPGIRRVVYYVASAAAAGWAAYEASGENWRAAVPALLGAVITLTAGANASETPED
jgi:hypothetical protein